jgi:hypothetical protein
MEDDIDPGDGPLDRGGIGEVAERLLDAEFIKPRVRGARERSNLAALLPQEPHDRPAQESAATRDQGHHEAAPVPA